MAVFSAIGAALAGAFGAIFGAGAFATFLVNTLAQIATSFLVGLLMKKDTPEVFGTSGKLQGGDDVPRSFPVGVGFTEGSLVYASYWGRSGETPNAYFTQVVALSDLPIKGVVAVTVDGIYCTPETSAATDRPSLGEMLRTAFGTSNFFSLTQEYEGPATPDAEDFGVPLREYREDGQDHAWVKIYDGTQTVADPLLVEFAQHPDNPWTAQHIGTGIAYAVCTVRANNRLFSGFPRFGFVVDSVRLYNPAKDSTVGGDGPHRWDNPSTWGGEGDYSPVVQAYNVLRGISYNGRWLYGFQGVSAGRLPAAAWINEINKCKVLVPTPEGQRPAFRAGGILPVSAECGNALQAIMASCGGRIAEIGGIYKPLAAGPNAPVMHIDEFDIIASEGHGFQPITRLADRINAITAQYPAPEEGFTMKAATPLFRPDLEADDGGRRLPGELNLANVPYVDQVSRLMDVALKEARRDRRHAFVLPPRFYRLEPLDTVTFTSPQRGYENKSFIVQSAAIRSDCHVMVELVELDPDDYDFSLFDRYPDEPPALLEPITPVSAGLIGLQISAAFMRDADGNERRPAILVAWDAEQARQFSAVTVEVRVNAVGAESFQVTTAQIEAPLWIFQGILPATTYQVRAAPIWNGRPVWSDWVLVTTPDIRTGRDDLDDAVRLILDASEQLQQDVTDLVAETAALRAEVAADFSVTIPRIADVERAAEAIATQVAWLAAVASRTESTIADAGIYVDPATGQVRIEAVSRLDEKITEASIRVDAVEGEIALKVTQADVDLAIAAAQIDPAELPIITGLTGRVTDLEVSLDAAEAAIDQRATLVQFEGLETTVTTAGTRIDALEAQIVQRVETATFELLETRVQTAEVTLAAIDGAGLVLQVEDVRQRLDGTEGLADATLADIARLHQEGLARLADAAVVRQEYHALVSDEREARASLRTELGAAIDANAATIVQESQVRASETQALGSLISALTATVGENTAQITAESAARSTADSALASQLNTVQARTDANEAAIVSESAARSTADGALAAQISSVQAQTNSNAAQIAAESAARTSADSALAQQVNTVSAVANGRNRTFSQTTAPSGANVGDIWYDTSAGGQRRPRRWNGSTWVFVDDLRVGSISASVDQIATAVADLEGNAAASFVLRARALGASGEIEVVAASNPSGAAQSLVRMRADRFRFEGGAALFGGAIQSDSFEAGESGWRIRQNGQAEFNNVVISRPLVLAQGQITVPSGVGSGGSVDLPFVNTGIRIGDDDVFDLQRVALVAVARLLPASASGVQSGSLWRAKADVFNSFKWTGAANWSSGLNFQFPWTQDPAVLVTPAWATGTGQRVLLDINLRTSLINASGPLTVGWKVFQVT